MKKIIAVITVLALCLVFSSCSKKSVDEPTTDEMSSTAEVTEAQSQTEAESTTQELTTEAPQTQTPTKAVPQTQKPTQKPTQAATKAPTQAPKPQAAIPPKAITGFESEMLELCNQQRRANGKPTLCSTKLFVPMPLSEQKKFQEMIGFHTEDPTALCALPQLPWII